MSQEVQRLWETAQGSCQCGNILLIPDQHDGRGESRDSKDDPSTGKQDKNSGGSLNLIVKLLHKELVAFKRTPAWHRAQGLREKERRGSVSQGGRSGSLQRSNGNNSRRTSNDFARGSTSQRAGSRSQNQATEEEDHERILLCAICDTDVAQAQVEIKIESNPDTGGDEQAVIVPTKVNNVLVPLKSSKDGSFHLPSFQEASESLIYPLDLSMLPLSETYGAPPHLPVPPEFDSLLAPLADPFFLPPPFTPSDPYFRRLAEDATSKIKATRAQVDREIEDFVAQKRKIVAGVQRRARGECEIMWKSYEKVMRMKGVWMDDDAGNTGANSANNGWLASRVPGATSGESQAPAGSSRRDSISSPQVGFREGSSSRSQQLAERPSDSSPPPPITGSAVVDADDSVVPDGGNTLGRISPMAIRDSRFNASNIAGSTGAGASLLSASISAGNNEFLSPNNRSTRSARNSHGSNGPGEGTGESTPRPQKVDHSPFFKNSPSPNRNEDAGHPIRKPSQNGQESAGEHTSLITSPFSRGRMTTANGVDLDVASSLRISHMDQRFGGASQGANEPRGSQAVTSEMHHSFSLSKRGTRGPVGRYKDPLDTDLDVEKDDPEKQNQHLSRGGEQRGGVRSGLDSVKERSKEEEREGGEGDIKLEPFGESTQASAASSYKDHLSSQSEDESETRRGRGTHQRRRGSDASSSEGQERVTRPRCVKQVSSSSPETFRRLPRSASPEEKEGEQPGSTEIESKQQRISESPKPSSTKQEPPTPTLSAPNSSRKKSVKFDEAAVAKHDRDQVAMDKGEGAKTHTSSQPTQIPERVEDAKGREASDEDEDDERGLVSGPDDAVFDFEEHDADQPSVSPSAPPPPPDIKDPQAAQAALSPDRPNEGDTMRENTELVQNKLIQLMAADAPSHRSAWRNDTQKLWQALGRTTNRAFLSPAGKQKVVGVQRRHLSDGPRRQDDRDNQDEESNPSLFATSVPVEIALPSRESGPIGNLEPKTSWTERKGTLVPSLRKAMRSSGDKQPPKPASSTYVPDRKVSTETKQIPTGGKGASLTSRGKNTEEDDEDDEENWSTLASVPRIAIPSSQRQEGQLTSPNSAVAGSMIPNASSKNAVGTSVGGPGMSYGGYSVDPGLALDSIGSLSEEEDGGLPASGKAGQPGFIPPHRQDRS